MAGTRSVSLLVSALCLWAAMPACTTTTATPAEAEPSIMAPVDPEPGVALGQPSDFARVGLSVSTSYYLPLTALKGLSDKVEAAKALLVSQPLDAAAFKTLAYDALVRANPDGALVYLQTAEATQDSEWLMLAGVARLMRGDSSEGLALLEQSANSGSPEGIADFNIGVFHYVHGNNGSALAYFKRALNVTPRNPTVRLFAGAASFSLRDYPQAEQHLVVAIKGARDKSMARYNLGMVYRSGYRDLSLARQVFRALMDDPATQEQVRVLALGALENIERESQGMPEVAMMTSLD